jgi:hypothetical protein
MTVIVDADFFLHEKKPAAFFPVVVFNASFKENAGIGKPPNNQCCGML